MELQTLPLKRGNTTEASQLSCVEGRPENSYKPDGKYPKPSMADGEVSSGASPALQTCTNITGKAMLVGQLGGEHVRTRPIQMHHVLILLTKINSTTSVFCGMQEVFR